MSSSSTEVSGDVDPSGSSANNLIEPRLRRRHAAPVSRARSVYEWTLIVLLLASSLVGVFLFGAVRLWSVGPLMSACWLVVALFLARGLGGAEGNRFQVPPGGMAWLVFFLYAAAQLPFALIPYEARIDLLKLGSYIGAYWVWSELSARFKRWRILVSLAILVVSVIGWYAVIQHAQGSRMVLNLERPETYGMRASGTYFCPNHFANLLEILLPFCLAILLMKGAGAATRLVAGYGLALFLPVMFLTQSRSGWIATVAGLGTTACLLASRKNLKWFFLSLVLVPLVAAAAAWGLWTFSDVFRDRVLDALQGNIRLGIWRNTLDMVREKPLFGQGGGAFPWVYPKFRTIGDQLFFNYVHNEYLQTLAEYGIVGFVLFGAAVLRALYVFLRCFIRVERDRDAYLLAGLFGMAAGTLAHACFDFNYHIYSNSHVVVLLAGTVTGCLYASGELRPRTLPPAPARVIRGVGFVAALVLMTVSLQAYLSHMFHMFAEKEREKFSMDRARVLYKRAMRADPANWRAPLGEAHVLQTQAFWNYDPEAKREQATQAEALYERAIGQNPCLPEALFGLGKIFNVLGQPEKALDSLRQAVAFDSNHVFYVAQLGLQLRKMGRTQEAYDVFLSARQRWENEIITLNLQALHDELNPPAPSTQAPPTETPQNRPAEDLQPPQP